MQRFGWLRLRCAASCMPMPSVKHPVCVSRTAGKSSQSRPAAGAAADSDDDWDTGRGKGGKGKRGKGGAKGKRGGGTAGGRTAVAASNGGARQPGGGDGGPRLLSTEALEQKLNEWCPDLEDSPPELVRNSLVTLQTAPALAGMHYLLARARYVTPPSVMGCPSNVYGSMHIDR